MEWPDECLCFVGIHYQNIGQTITSRCLINQLGWREAHHRQAQSTQNNYGLTV